jgi:tRNA U34 5-methylaminomethyl-2-thiouridine-forming methyltransferase MnmC
MIPAFTTPCMKEFELVSVESGVKSIRSLDFGQTFHPVTGPMAEARALHVVQQRLAERAAANQTGFVIWDVGFGAAANSIAAIETLSGRGGRIRISSFDRTTASIEFALEHASDLEYVKAHETVLRKLLSDKTANIADPDSGTRIEWQLHIGDFCEVVRNPPREAPHAIFYDPYSPAANPDMWTLEHFSLLRKHLDEEVPCLWTNYTRSTAVRATLLLAGFFVGRGCAIGGKEETTVASNDLRLVKRPLDARWLERAARSANAAPLRGGGISPAKIATKDLESLKAHPQFTDR